MRELSLDARQNLYQSQWWTRLAAFTETPDRRLPVKISRKEEATSVVKTLASFFRGFTFLRSDGLTNSSR